MSISKIKNNKTNKKVSKLFSGGFTLIETIVAIFILSLTIGALLTLTTGGIYSVRYARNQIVADNLMQESLEYLRNERDKAAQAGLTWDQWLQTLNVSESGTPVDMSTPRGCFRDDGCIVDPYTTSSPIKECQQVCSIVLFYPDHGFYGYDTFYPFGTPTFVPTSFVRKIHVVRTAPDQLVVEALITWQNGLNAKSVEQSMTLTNWHI